MLDLVFGGYYYKFGGNANTFSSAEYADKTNGAIAFDIRRLYPGYAYNFTSRVSTKVMVAHERDVLPDWNRVVYLKIAEVTIKNIIPNGNLIVGQTGTPTFAKFTEGIWVYRSIEKTILDMCGLGRGIDLGFQLQGNFNDSGTISHILMVGNGTGPKLKNNKSKKIYAELYGHLFNKKFLWEGYFDYQRGTDNQNRMTVKGFTGYQVPEITLGLTATKQWRNNAISPGIDNDPSWLSLFAHGPFIKGKLNGYVRYDLFNPDRSSQYNENFFSIGDRLPAHT